MPQVYYPSPRLIDAYRQAHPDDTQPLLSDISAWGTANGFGAADLSWGGAGADLAGNLGGVGEDTAAAAERARRSRIALNNANAQAALMNAQAALARTGFDDRNSLAQLQQRIREFDLTQAENRRQFDASLAERARQFDTTENRERAAMILNAPKGPADAFTYLARMRGLADRGFVTDTLRGAIEGATGMSIGQLQQQPVLTNTQLALGLADAAAGRPMDQNAANFLSRTFGRPRSAVGQGVQQPMVAAIPPPPPTSIWGTLKDENGNWIEPSYTGMTEADWRAFSAANPTRGRGNVDLREAGYTWDPVAGDFWMNEPGRSAADTEGPDWAYATGRQYFGGLAGGQGRYASVGGTVVNPTTLAGLANTGYLGGRPDFSVRNTVHNTSFANSGTVNNPPHYQSGTNFVPATGPAIVHRGEAIIPASQNPFPVNAWQGSRGIQSPWTWDTGVASTPLGSNAARGFLGNPLGGFQTSAQEFGRMMPGGQVAYLNLIGESGGQTPEDFLSELRKGSLSFRPSSPVRFG